MTADELAKAEQHFEYTEGEAWAYGPSLIAEVRRLRGLIDAAEWAGQCQGDDCCPWCQGAPCWYNGLGEVGGGHTADCQAFPNDRHGKPCPWCEGAWDAVAGRPAHEVGCVAFPVAHR